MAEGDLYALSLQASRSLNREIVPGVNEVVLHPGIYMISYTVSSDGSTAGAYRVIPMLNGMPMAQYSAGAVATAGAQSSASASFIINPAAASVFQLRASISGTSMNQNVSVSIVKLI